MERLDLSATTREKGNGGAASRLRAESMVPAILYGQRVKENVNLSLKMIDVEKALGKSEGGNALVNLKVDGSGARVVMFKDIQRHPVRETLQHVDFLEVIMDETVTVDVPVHMTGKCEGVNLGGILEQTSRTMKVTCLPDDIPSSFDIDVTNLLIGDSVQVKDIEMPKGVKAEDSDDHTLVLVTQPRVEKAASAGGEEGAEGDEASSAEGEAKEDKKD